MIFGKILAGEIKAPGSFSARTLQSLGYLTHSTANMLQTFFNMSIKVANYGARVVSNPFGPAGQNSLRDVGLPYDHLMKLVEYGFVRPDFSEWIEFPSILYKSSLPFNYAGLTVWLAPSTHAEEEKLPSGLRLEGLTLTQVGNELRSVVAMTPQFQYIEKFKEWLKAQNLTIFRAVGQDGNELRGIPL